MSVIALLRPVLFLLSFWGYCEFLRRKTDMDSSFLPSAVIAVQSVLIFGAGILGFLKLGTLMIFTLGLGMLAQAVFQDRGIRFLKNYLSPAYCFLLVMSIFAGWYLRDKIFTHYDNFSHWAMVARTMLETNRFPNFLDQLIQFQEYPLGSSGYIYYFVKLVGRSEPAMMFAQVFMMLAAVMPVFAFCKKNQWVMLPLAAFMMNFFWVFNVRINDLLVDTLLPLVAMCGLSFLYLNRDKLHRDTWEFWVAAAYLAHISQIKDSGLFFVAIAYVGLLVLARHRKQWQDMVLLAIIPLLFVFLWKSHCGYVFAESATSRHSTSLQYMTYIFHEKDASMILSICKAMFRHSVFSTDFWAVLASLAAGIGICIWTAPEKKKPLLMVFLGFIAVYAGFQIAMTGMYIFSMPASDAQYLGSVDRYTCTTLTAGLYLLLCVAGIALSKPSLHRPVGLGVLYIGIVLCCMIVTKGNLYTFFSPPIPESERRYLDNRIWVEGLIEQYNLPEDVPYRVLVPEASTWFLPYLTKYLLHAPDIGEVTIDNAEDLGDSILILPDPENPEIQEWVRSHYPEQLGNAVIVP